MHKKLYILLRLRFKQQIMYSNEDLERFYFQYRLEAVAFGKYIPSFCKRNNVLYYIFSKWHKDARKKNSGGLCRWSPLGGFRSRAIFFRSRALECSVQPRIMVDMSVSNCLCFFAEKLETSGATAMTENLAARY